jgi:hypothetical protein
MPFRMPFAGEGEFFSPDSVLSHCYGALLPMFDTAEATVLRQLCREFKTTVADFPWEDEETIIQGSVAAWRACFPRARWANVTGHNDDTSSGSDGRRTPVVDADFVHFVGLRRLNMSFCPSITDAAFVHLKGIHTLSIAGCKQPSLTDAAFIHLKGLYSLNMYACDGPTITEAAFVHLKGIHSLSLHCCGQLTNLIFAHLKGVKRLNIGQCYDLTFEDDSLKGIEWLNMCLRNKLIKPRPLGSHSSPHAT